MHVKVILEMGLSRRYARFSGLCAAVTVAFLAAAQAHGQWASETVTGERSLEHGQLALDAAGQPMIAYGGDVLRLARYVAGGWQVEIVDASTCGYDNVVIAADATGFPTIAYREPETNTLKATTWDGVGWTTTVIDDSGRVNAGTSVAIQVDGYPAVAYRGLQGLGLVVARFDGAVWSPEEITATGVRNSIAVDGNGELALSYYDSPNRDLVLARRAGGAWPAEIVDAIGWTGEHNSLAFDADGDPVIAYWSRDEGLRLARQDAGVWALETVVADPDDGLYASLALDSADEPVVGFYANDNGRYYVARSKAGVWTVDEVDTGFRGTFASVAIDSADNIMTSYIELTDDDLRFARFDGVDTWTVEEVDVFAEPVGGVASLGIAPNDDLGVTYARGVNGGMKVALWNGGAWTTRMVDASAGLFSSIGFDPDANWGIAYSVLGDLKYAYLDVGTWRKQTVDSPGSVGGYPSLAFDATAAPAISYNDDTNDALKLARWNGVDTWTSEVVDADNAGRFTSLAFDRDGYPAIAYQRYSTEDLCFARWNGAIWEYWTVDTDEAGREVSLALDGDGNPRIAYHDIRARDLRYAWYDGVDWHLETIGPAGGSGATSIRIDADDYSRIAYYFGAGRDAQLASWTGAVWEFEVIDGPGDVGDDASLVLDSRGDPVVAYFARCEESLRVARKDTARAAVLYRGEVASFASGWRAAAFPLTDINDVATPPFPVATTTGLSEADPLPATLLVTYRVLIDGSTDAGNILRVVSGPGGPEIRY